MSGIVIIKISFLVVLLLCSGFFSGSETSLFSLGRVERYRIREEKETFVSRCLQALVERPRRLIVTVLIGNELVNITIAALGASLMDRYETAYGKRPRTAVGAPIRTEKYQYREPEDFYLTAGGLRFNKRVDWQIRAASRTGIKLVVAGGGQEMKHLKSLANKLDANVEFKGRVGEDELLDLYSRCKAFIFTAMNEDFGMVPLEAMASGKPVFCVNEGGPLEYLDSSTSFLFNDIDGLVKLLKSVKDEQMTAMKNACIEKAKEFDAPKVADRIKNEMMAVLKEFY